MHLADLARLSASMALLVMPSMHPALDYQAQLTQLRQIVAGQLFRRGEPCRDGADQARIALLGDMAQAAGLRLTAAGDALYHIAERRPLADVLTCIRENSCWTRQAICSRAMQNGS